MTAAWAVQYCCWLDRLFGLLTSNTVLMTQASMIRSSSATITYSYCSLHRQGSGSRHHGLPPGISRSSLSVACLFTVFVGLHSRLLAGPGGPLLILLDRRTSTRARGRPTCPCPWRSSASTPSATSSSPASASPGCTAPGSGRLATQVCCLPAAAAARRQVHWMQMATAAA